MPDPFVRVDVWSLADNDPIITAYADAVAAMKLKPATDPTSWSYQAAIHGTQVASPLPQWNQCRHGSWYFLPWHRMYLYYFERIVRAQVIANGGPATWALPYWNYDGGTDHNQLPLAFRNPTRPDSSPNPLYVANRNNGINAGAGLPSSVTSPAFAMSRTLFTGASEFGGGVTSPLGRFWSETGRLEQTPHNDVHVVIGGWMGNPDTAAQDPIFWLHHANIDRIWWLWHKHYLDPTDPNWQNQSFDFVDENSAPASLTDSGVEDTENQLGYTYDHARVRIPWPPKLKLRAPIRWPIPWPEIPPHLPPGPGPDPGPEGMIRHMVGASERPIQLVGDTVRVPVGVDQRAIEARQSITAAPHQQRVFLDIEDIRAERNPGTVYGVYVNLPEQPTDEDLSTHHVGNISLFGVERAQNPRGDEHGHGLKVSMEVTELLDHLAESGKWAAGDQVDVTLRPITLEPPAHLAETQRTAMLAEVAHPETPITLGRVSLHFG
jgi:tyrosinase